MNAATKSTQCSGKAFMGGVTATNESINDVLSGG